MTKLETDTSDGLIDTLSREIFRDHASTVASSKNEVEVVLLDRHLWTAIAQSGFDRMLAHSDESALHDALRLLHHAGYYAGRAPVAEVMLAHWLAWLAGSHEDSALPIAAPARVQPDGSSGLVARAPWARAATALYIWIDGRLGRLGADALRIQPGENLAREPDDLVTFARDAVEWRDVPVIVEEFLARGALLKAALMTGAMERALDLALDHAAVRKQFGKPIASFQAVQQLLAQLAGHVAAAAAAVDLGGALGTVFGAAIAKSRAGEAAGFAADVAHQVIGAIGLTVEHPLHLVTRRLWSWREEWENETYWNERIGRAVLASGGDRLWPRITEGPRAT
jgi:hypothetical protein